MSNDDFEYEDFPAEYDDAPEDGQEGNVPAPAEAVAAGPVIAQPWKKSLRHLSGLESPLSSLFLANAEHLEVFTAASHRYGWAGRLCVFGPWRISCLVATPCRRLRAAVQQWRAQQHRMVLDWLTPQASLRACVRECNLRVLIIEANCIALSDDTMLYVAMNCPALEELRVVLTHQSAMKISESSICGIARHCPSLKALELRHQFLLNGIAPHSSVLTAGAATELVVRCRHLTELDLSGQAHITNEAVQCMAHIVTLTSLNLADIPKLSNAAFSGSARLWLRLQRLNLGKSPISITEAFPSCPALTDLAVGGNGSPLRVLSTATPFLEKLRLTFADAQTDFRGVDLPRLRELRLSDTGFQGRGLADAVLPLLTHLNLRDSKITDGALASAAQSLPALEFLDASVFEGIGDRAAAALARHCSSLKHVDVSLSKVTDDGIVSLAKLPLLSLDMHCLAITDRAFASLSHHPHLQKLGMEGEDCQATDAGLLALVESCQGLLEIRMNDYDSFTKEGADRVEAVLRERRKRVS